jgi:hypothetical protein
MRKFTEKIAAYYAEARHRAGRRKSPWNLLLIVFGFCAWLAVWYGLFKLIWIFHVAIYPEHQFRDFWQADAGFRSAILSFLMLFSPMPAAIIIGMLFANSVFWLIKPLRRIFETEAQGYEGTSFRRSMRSLLKACAWALPIGIGVALTAAYFLKTLR